MKEARSDVFKISLRLSFTQLALLASFVLHMAIVVAVYFNSQNQEMSQSDLPVETRLLSEAELKQMNNQWKQQRHVVQSEKAAKSLAVTKPAPYLSEHTQRVKKQSRAKNFASLNKKATSFKKKNLKKALKKKSSKVTKLRKLGLSNAFFTESAKSKILDQNSGNQEYGSHDYVHSDVAIGGRTMLNTDAYKYASFFNRFKDQVSGHWIDITDQELKARVPPPGLYHTMLNIRLDRSGNILRISLRKRSGQQVFDQAAISALKKMGKILNPPSELFGAKQDFEFDFHFSYSFAASTLQYQRSS